jgi:homoaconitase/3-isopropylmalate dehydratase large subunit
MGLTLVEKIAARHADGLAPGTQVRSGDFVSIRPRHVMTHDNTGAVIPKFKQIGATSIADPAQPVFAIDHDIQNVRPKIWRSTRRSRRSRASTTSIFTRRAPAFRIK